ncbi:MAG: TrbG/VirB9 family P-type conjugative transfer protein [Thiobacillaceae bacterium]
MNKLTLITTLALIMAGPALAAPPAEPSSLDVYYYLTKDHIPGPGISREAAQLKAAQTWLETDTAPPIAGNFGEVMYAYGHSHPRVLCAPLDLCVVKLMSGEKIINLSIGDSVRWLVQPAQAGDRPVVVVKPTTAGLHTNLVITTDTGHVYYLDLESDKSDFVPIIAFYDPEKLVRTVNEQQALAAEKTKREAEARVAVLSGVNPADLDFAYWWDGPKQLQPVRVFSAEGKVFIQMPPDMKHADAPALFVIEHDKEQLTNYRLSGSYYVVDQLFQEARLVLGVDRDRSVVTIHAGKKPFWTGFGD